MSTDEYRKRHNVEKMVSEHSRKKLAKTQENFVNKYGEKEGMLRWNSYCEKQRVSNTFEYKAERHGMTEEDFKVYNHSRAATLENMIKRHGKEEGLRRFEDYRDRQRYAGVSLEYFQEKYGLEEGERVFRELNQKKAFTFDSFKQRNPLATIDDFDKSVNGRRKVATQSKSSKKFFENLISYYGIVKENIRFEFGKVDPLTKKYYFYDFVDLNKKLCIEYHGDLYHANPAKFSQDDIPPFPSNTKTAAELWKYDEEKRDLIQGLGFDFVVVWEGDVKQSLLSELKRFEKYYAN